MRTGESDPIHSVKCDDLHLYTYLWQVHGLMD